jgi:FtsH-binding integral membrane protein
MKLLVGKLGTLLLAIWLILTGLIPLLNLNIPSGELILAVVAIVAGILILLEIREQPTKNIGRLLLSIWLIVMGLFPLLNVEFSAKDIVMAVLALVAGVMLLLGR